MPKEWTPEERAAAGRRLKEARQRKQQLKQTAQVAPQSFDERFKNAQTNRAVIESVERDDVLDLLKWVARSIVTINMAGKKMTNKCRLCDTSKLHREPCRHGEVWALAGK